jgi:hypothetical protein
MQYLVVLSSRSGPLEKEAGWVLNGVKRKGKVVTVLPASELGIVNVTCLSALSYHWPEREHPEILCILLHTLASICFS